MTEIFLPGVAREHVMSRLEAAGGNEIASGKLLHPEISAALAVNSFGWFIDRPDALPSLPGTADMGGVEGVEIEYCARFPWSGGRHPWLDAAVVAESHLIGVESKRFEPFRDAKRGSLSPAYDRPVFGDNMHRYGAVRDALRSGALRFRHLDAVQLVKHGYGLVTDARRIGKRPVLFYLFAEPSERAGRAITADDHQRHRDEIAIFASAIEGDEVLFRASSYKEWLEIWPSTGAIADHARRLIDRFKL